MEKERRELKYYLISQINPSGELCEDDIQGNYYVFEVSIDRLEKMIGAMTEVPHLEKKLGLRTTCVREYWYAGFVLEKLPEVMYGHGSPMEKSHVLHFLDKGEWVLFHTDQDLGDEHMLGYFKLETQRFQYYPNLVEIVLDFEGHYIYPSKLSVDLLLRIKRQIPGKTLSMELSEMGTEDLWCLWDNFWEERSQEGPGVFNWYSQSKYTETTEAEWIDALNREIQTRSAR